MKLGLMGSIDSDKTLINYFELLSYLSEYYDDDGDMRKEKNVDNEVRKCFFLVSGCE
jgi:hypothetical protein